MPPHACLSDRNTCFGLRLAALVLAFALLPLQMARAQGPTPAEMAAGMACLRQVCQVLSGGKDSPRKVTCNLSRHWSRDEVQEALQQRLKLKWPLGSAFCKVRVDVPARRFTEAVAAGENSFTVPPQAVTCALERGEKTHSVNFTLAPHLKMQDGVSTAASINIADVRGPVAIRAVLWLVQKLERAYNPFEDGIIKSVNAFLQHGCPPSVRQKRHGQQAPSAGKTAAMAQNLPPPPEK